MATQFAEIITGYAIPLIDDVRMQETMTMNPALFMRRMTVYMGVAIPLLNRPPTLTAHLLDNFNEAQYDSFYWTSTEDEQSGVIQTGIVGYDTMGCQANIIGRDGSVFSEGVPNATYDPETGAVTIPAGYPVGTEFQMDFYTDGSFGVDLTARIKRLVGLAMAIVWDERFTRNWLNMQMKVHDKSFDTVNESTYLRETTNRLSKNRSAFYDEMAKYEQDCTYAKVIQPNSRQQVFL